MISRSVAASFLFWIVSSKAMQSTSEIMNSGEFSVLNTLLEHTMPSESKPFLETISQDNRPLTFFVARDTGFSDLKEAKYLAKLMMSSYRMHLYSLMSSQITDQQVKAVLEQPPEQRNSFSFENLYGESIDLYAGADNTVYLGSAYNDVPAKVERLVPSSDDALIVPTDNIILPNWITMNLVGYLQGYDAYSSISTYTTFSSLLIAGNMDDTVRESEDFTLFAPINQGLSDELVEDLLENPEILTNFLKHHMLSTVLNVRELTEVQLLHTDAGECVLAHPTEKRGILIGESQLMGYQLVRYGVLYKIDGPLIPPSWK